MKIYSKIFLAAFLALLAAGTTTAFAQNQKDDMFVKKAQSGGNKEVRLGQLASERAVAPQVKAYGEMMVKDHQAAQGELSQLLQQKDYRLPDNENKDADKSYEKLSKCPAGDFDENYMNEMVKDHEKVVALFEKEAEKGDDPEIRQWAKGKLPVLQQHLKNAQNILAFLKSGK